MHPNAPGCSRHVSSTPPGRRLWEVVAHGKEVVVYPQMIVAGSGAAASTSSGDRFVADCGTSSPGIACRLVWDLTHSTSAADLTRVYLAGPAQIVIRIGFVVLIALVIRLAAHRAIRRVTARAAKDSSNGTDRAHGLLFGERRQQRATALGSILSNAASLTIFGIAPGSIRLDLGLYLRPLPATIAATA